MILRDYQEKWEQDIRGAYRAGFHRPLGVLPTGAGKTVVFAHITQSAAALENNVLILVHRWQLLRQVCAALDNDCGCIKAGITERPHRVQVATVGTLVNRIQKRDYEFDLIIIDEAHHAKAATYMKILDAFPNAKVLGVTATPCRMDGKGLGDIFDVLVEGPTVEELTARGHLSPAIVYAPSIPDLTDVKTVRGDFDGRQLSTVMNSKITGDAITHYRRLANHVPALASCVDVAHAEATAEAFNEAGYNAVAVDGKTPEPERVAALEGLADGSMHVVSYCELFGEGVDVPVVGCAILLRPTQSLGLYLQQVGRVLRSSPGKTQAIILDHAGNALRHGTPDMPREWSLDMTRKQSKLAKEKLPPIKTCPECFGVHKTAPVCPYCAYVYKVEAREVEHVKGELVEVDKAKLVAVHRAEVRGATTRTELEALGKDRGYKPGWAWHIMESRKKRKGAAVNE